MVARNLADLVSVVLGAPHDPVAPPEPVLVKARRGYLVGRFSGSLGSGMVALASSYLIYQQTHSVAAVALISVATNLPALALASAATRLANRWGGPKLYVVTLGAYYLLCIVPFLLALTGHLSATSLLVWYLLRGIALGLNTPSIGMVRIVLSPPGQTTEFNSAATRAVSWATLVGVLIGGLVLTHLGAAWIYLGAGILGLPPILALVPLLPWSISADSSSASRFGAYFSVRRQHPELRAAFRYTVLISLIAGYAVTLPAVADHIGHRADLLALLQAAAVFGGLFVVVATRKIHGRVRWLRVQRTCVFISAVSLLFLGWVAHLHGQPPVLLLLALVVLMPLGFALNLDASVLNGLVQVAAPIESRAAVLTAYALIPMVVTPLSQLVISGVADLTSVTLALVAMGGVTLLFFFLPHKKLRTSFALLDDSLGPPTPLTPFDGHHVTSVQELRDAGQPIADQMPGPELPDRKDVEG